MHPELDHDKIEKIQQLKEEPKSSLLKFWSGLKSGFKSKYKQMKNYVFGESNKEEPSLSVYMNNHLILLTGKIPLNGTNPIEVVNEIVYIYQSLYKYYFHFDGYSHLVSRDDIKKVGVCIMLHSCGHSAYVCMMNHTTMKYWYLAKCIE